MNEEVKIVDVEAVVPTESTEVPNETVEVTPEVESEVKTDVQEVTA